MAAAQAAFPAPAESPADEFAVQAVAGQLETVSNASDVQLAVVSGDWNSDPSQTRLNITNLAQPNLDIVLQFNNRQSLASSH